MKNQILLATYGAAALLLNLGGIARGASEPGQTLPGTIRVGELTRQYRVHVPASLTGNKPVPAVFVFHGGGGDYTQAEKLGFDRLSDRDGFLVVYPNAIDRNWNDLRADHRSKSHQNNIDDLGFIEALLDKLSGEYRIDPKRVFCTGASNGGILSHTVGARLSGRFAAIAPVIGGIATPVAESFSPEHPVSVLIINGTDDPLVPYDGGGIGESSIIGGRRGDIVSTDQAVKQWVGHNRCQSEPARAELANRAKFDGCEVERFTYSGGRDGTEVVLYRIDGGGHTWPGGRRYLPRRIIGKVCRDFDATETIWEFFKNHPRR